MPYPALFRKLFAHEGAGPKLKSSLMPGSYAICSTAAATAAKTVTLDDFSLSEGAVVHVYFSNTNSNSGPTLNVNGTGAKSIRYNGAAYTELNSGCVYSFIYDGTYWQLLSGGGGGDDELEAFRKSMIGVPRYWRSTSLPDNHCWANGDLVYFSDWPELEEVYNAGGFSGMTMAYNASSSTRSSNLGKWRPNASSPTGLYTPNLASQFLRATSASGGTTNSAGLPNITGGTTSDFTDLDSFVTNTQGTGWGAWSATQKECYLIQKHTETDIKTGEVQINASNSNSIYGSSSTVMPASVNIPMIIYLGASA